MSAISCPPLLQLDRLQLLALLKNCQRLARASGHEQIASFTIPLEDIDPLAALLPVLGATTSEPYFYWEHPHARDAEAAIGTARALQLATGGDRFARARAFVAATRACCPGEATTQMRFYQGFSFFETSACFPSAWVALPRWQIARRQGRCSLTANIPIGPTDDLETCWQEVATCLGAIARSSSLVLPGDKAALVRYRLEADATLDRTYTKAVSAALQAIADGPLQKIVLAYSLMVRSPQRFDPVEALAYLRQQHPHCRTFAVSLGTEAQTFVGASPERLVALQDGQIECDALAGSVGRGRTPAEDAELARQLLANAKERREHQAVRGFLHDRLCQLGLQPQMAEMRLLKLPNIQHLWTPIRADAPATLHLLDLVAGLHPTPAVAGLPTPDACEGIRRWEAFDRGPYAAPLGWLDGRGNGEFVVGIRSALLSGQQARLYAGAGIVAGSTPERERAEVALKLQAMLAALGCSGLEGS